MLKNVTKFIKTHSERRMWINPSTLVEGAMKRLVWALCRADSSLVSNHLVINNNISEWIRVVADTNRRDKKVTKQRSRLIWSFLQRNWVPCLTHTHKQTNVHTLKQFSFSHKLTCTHTHMNMHTFWHTTVVKHEAWILINQFVRQKDRPSLPCSLQIWFQRLCSQAHMWFADSVRGLECDWSPISCGVRHSEEWHHSLEKVKDKKSFLKPLKKFKILFFFLFSSPAGLPPLTQNSSVMKRWQETYVCCCLDALYTLRILDILFVCMHISKMWNSCVQVLAQMWLCVCRLWL